MSYDYEDVLSDVESILKANLNAEITSINTAKGDGFLMGQIDSDAYAYQSMDDKFFNYSQFVFFGIVDVEAIQSGPYTGESLTIAVTVISQNNSNIGSTGSTKIMLRYQKALKNIFKNNWQSSGLKNKIEITSLVPGMIEGLNSTEKLRIVGIELKTTIS